MADRAERLRILREAASLGDYRTACASDWDTAAPEDVDEATQIPVIDFVSGGAIDKDDLVVLSDGKCYSKSSMRLVVQQSPRRLDGQVMLATQTPMLPEDFALLGIAAPAPRVFALVPQRPIAPQQQQPRRRDAQEDYVEWKRGNELVLRIGHDDDFARRIA